MQQGNNFNYPAVLDAQFNALSTVLSQLGDIHNKLNNVIHIAGTNGKGSTTAFIKNILQHCGFSVNVFTSPHLVKFNERIYIKGNFITDNELRLLKNQLQLISESSDLNFFETSFVLAAMAFYKAGADFTLLEVGLGGRLDATNIIAQPLVSVIAHIDYDHQELLGNTLGKIALEKAHIIKVNSVVIKSAQQSKILEVFKTFASKVASQTIIENTNYYIKRNKLYYNNYIIPLSPGLIGDHQKHNAALACVAAVNAMERVHKSFTINNIAQGIKNTKWPGRLQQISNIYNYNGQIYLDGAHNVNGAKALCKFIRKQAHKGGNVNIIVGMLAKKDLLGFVKQFSKLNNQLNFNAQITFYPISILNHNSYTVQQILTSCSGLGLQCKVVVGANFNGTMASIFQSIQQHSTNNLNIICGSLYLVGNVLSSLSNVDELFGINH